VPNKLLVMREYLTDPRRPDDQALLFGSDSGAWLSVAVAHIRAGGEAEEAIDAADKVITAFRYRAGAGVTLEQIDNARSVEKES